MDSSKYRGWARALGYLLALVIPVCVISCVPLSTQADTAAPPVSPSLAIGTPVPVVQEPQPPARESAGRLTLTDLGYSSDVRLQGAHGAISLNFALPQGETSGGQVTLLLHPSPSLDPRSTVQVFANDQMLTAITVEQLRASSTVTASLGSQDGDSVSLRVAGNLWISDDRCADEASNNLWVSLGQGSALTYRYASQAGSIRDFLRFPGGTLVMHGLWDSPQNSSASINLFSALQHYFRNSPAQVLLSEDLTGNPAEPVRHVYLQTNASPLLQLKEGKLYASTAPAALSVLQTEAGAAMMMGRTLETLDVAPKSGSNGLAADAAGNYRLALDKLGVTPGEVAGIGTMSLYAHFTLAELGGWPNDLSLYLDSAFDPVSLNASDRAVLRVRLNGTLLSTTDLRGKTSLQQTIALPANLIRAENYLEISFVYAPPSGDCRATPYQFAGQVRPGSYLTWTRYDKSHGIIPEIIGRTRGDGQIFFLDPAPAMAQAAARLLGGLSRFTPVALAPQPGTDPLAPSSAAYRILVGSTPAVSSALKAPVDLSNGVDIYNPRDNTTLLRGTPDQPLAVVQYVAEPQPLIILQRGPSGDGSQLAGVVARVTDSRRFFGLDGNVVLGTRGDVLVLDLSPTTLQQRTYAAPDWRDWLRRFRWLLWALLAALVVLGWSQVYRRMGRRAPLPPAPGADAQAAK